MTRIWGVLSVIPLLIVIGCGRADQQSVPAELSAAIDAFYRAIEAGDIEARIAMFDDSAIMMPSHWTMYKGKDAIVEMMRAGEGWVFKIRDRKIVDIDVDGHIAYTVNSYYYTWHAEDAEPQWHKTKNIHIWKKDAFGQWKLHADIWNSDVPMDKFSQE
ncbi:MAG: DUF4440 domain-containing protein [Candidatus Zixiibacteriota bacterium]